MILLIGDRPVSRQTLAELLRSSGHDILEAEDGKQALDLLDTHHVALVVTDLYLPDTDSLKLIDLFRQRQPVMPIIVLSGHISQEAGDAILNMTGKLMKFFLKPVVPLDLEATIKKLLDSPT